MGDGGREACFSGEPPLRGADGRGRDREAYASRDFPRGAEFLEGQRSMLSWGASAARG